MGAAQACPSEQTTATEFPFWVLSCACVWSRALSICRVPQDRCLLLSDRAHRDGMCPVSLGSYWRECGCCLVWFHFPKSVLSGAELCPLKFIQSNPDPQGFKVLMVFEDRL